MWQYYLQLLLNRTLLVYHTELAVILWPVASNVMFHLPIIVWFQLQDEHICCCFYAV